MTRKLIFKNGELNNIEIFVMISFTRLMRVMNDKILHFCSGGAGIGNPLNRDTENVRLDVMN